MNQNHEHEHNCHCQPSVAAQSLDEMDFDRGIWSAALYNDIKRLKQCIVLDQQNVTDKTGYTALHYASRSGHVDACKMLIDAGADVNKKTTSGRVTALMRASMMGHGAIVELLIRNGADIFVQDSDGNTALHKAAQNKQRDVFESLIRICNERDRERLIEIRNNRNQTAHDLLQET